MVFNGDDACILLHKYRYDHHDNLPQYLYLFLFKIDSIRFLEYDFVTELFQGLYNKVQLLRLIEYDNLELFNCQAV